MRTCVVNTLVVVAIGSVGSGAFAQEEAGAASATAGKHVCVNAEVNGARALSYDCLSQQLQPPPAASGASAANAAMGLATAPSNKTGTFNYSAERNRFGSN